MQKDLLGSLNQLLAISYLLLRLRGGFALKGLVAEHLLGLISLWQMTAFTCALLSRSSVISKLCTLLIYRPLLGLLQQLDLLQLLDGQILYWLQ